MQFLFGSWRTTIVPLVPCLHAYFCTIYPPRWPVAWIDMASTQTPFSCGNYHGCPATLFFCCYWSADRWCSNRCLGSMYVSLVTSYEPTKPPARVCCEIFTNVRWKQIKVTKKLFFWSDEIWYFYLVHHKSIFVLTPLTKSLPRQQPWFIYLLLTIQSLLWYTRNAKWIVRVACSRSGHKTDPWTTCGHSYV